MKLDSNWLKNTNGTPWWWYGGGTVGFVLGFGVSVFGFRFSFCSDCSCERGLLPVHVSSVSPLPFFSPFSCLLREKKIEKDFSEDFQILLEMLSYV